eukprot:TRINITY_DN4400_c2_g1_i2.p1 TRINITY_DN4400_c2_g1~~TRINITY_DN4400_c2_g1_i2.p1  ORF type:complete len:200 (-),score=14.37 TRINITY_DN4400_c2_g1_i2:119-718(-)
MSKSCLYLWSRSFKMWWPPTATARLWDWLWNWVVVLTVLNQFASMVSLKTDRLQRVEEFVWSTHYLDDKKKKQRRYDFYGRLCDTAFQSLHRHQAVILLLTWSDDDFELLVSGGGASLPGQRNPSGMQIRSSGLALAPQAAGEPDERVNQHGHLELRRRTGLCLLRALRACERCVLHVFDCDMSGRQPRPSIELPRAGQ